MKIRLGVDIACRSAHHAACADESGRLLWSGQRFRTDVADLEALWARVPANVDEVMVGMEPTRNAWVPLAAWFRRRGAVVVLVPSEQSSDLRDYLAKHTKTDHLDAEMLARLPVLHPEGLHLTEALGPGDPLKRAVKIRAGLVHRRTTAMARLDCLLEILGPGWIEALGTRMRDTTFKFLAAYANPHQVKRLGPARLARWFQHHTPQGLGTRAGRRDHRRRRGDAGPVGQRPPRLRSARCRHRRRGVHRPGGLRADRSPRSSYPRPLHRSRPQRNRPVGARRRRGPRQPNPRRLGDPARFTTLAGARAFSGLVPSRNASGLTDHSGGPTKRGDACLRAALFQAADRARKVDPQLAARYQRLMCDTRRHHTSATCTIAAVLLTRIVACLRNGTRYELRDVDGAPVTAAEGQAIVADRYQIPLEIRAARRSISRERSVRRRDERVKKGVALRSETPLVPSTA